MANNNSRNNSSTVILGDSSKHDHPTNLLSAVSQIQIYAANESKLEDELENNYFSIKQKLDIFILGLRNSLINGIFTVIFAPFSIGVIDNLIPMFGYKTTNFFVNIYSLILMFGISLSFGLFLRSLRTAYVGVISKLMIKNLMAGLTAGEIIKALIAILLYSYLFIQMSNKNLIAIAKWLYVNFGIQISVTEFNWIVTFRNIMPEAIVFVILSSIILLSIPIISIVRFAIGQKNAEMRKMTEI